MNGRPSEPGGRALHQGQPMARAGAALSRAKAAMILLHGRGASAEDILSLAQAFAQPEIAYFAPQAAGHSRNARRYGAVIGLSAGLIGPDGTSRTYSGSLQETPVFLGCSDVVPHIPLARVHESSRSLSNLGGAVEERVYPGMGHTINEDEIKRVHSLLMHQVSATPAGAKQIDPSVRQFKR